MSARNLIIRGSWLAAFVAVVFLWKASAGHRPVWIDRTVAWLNTGPAWLTDRRAAGFALVLLAFYFGVAVVWFFNARRRPSYEVGMIQLAAVVLGVIVLLVAGMVALAYWLHRGFALRWIGLMTAMPLVQIGVSLIVERNKAARKRKAK
jgi:hypothetical protein